MGREAEFPTEGAKIAFALSYVKGENVTSWVDWMFSLINERSREAPRTIDQFFQYLNAFFGDPDEKSTAKMKLDKLYQSGKVQDYVLAFQGLAWKTGYSDGELEH